MLRIFLVLAGLLITAHPLAASSPGDADGLFVVQAVDNLWNCAGERIEQNVFNGVVTDTILFYQHIIDTVKYWSYLNDL
ncbi:MAG: hypothetical protein KKC05_01095, partial [Nanoarchaeota archaeon]|nr:hypothetical protein [Nanoarchaeota archaeon]